MSDQLTSQGGVSDEEAAPGRSSLLGSPGPLADTLVVLGVFVALGLLCGVLWWLAVDPATFIKVKNGGTMSEVQLAKRFDSDGWYTVIAGVVGLVTGTVLTWWRSRDFLLTTVLLFVGAAIAAALMALVGYVLGPPDPKNVFAAAKLGAHIPSQLVVTGKAVYLSWPIASLVGALLVLWSSAKASQPEDHLDEE
jgi:hypothetical protein